MNISTAKVAQHGVPDKFKQLQINVALGLKEEIKVVFTSDSREKTGFTIYDSEGDSMGSRSLTYAGKNIDYFYVMLTEDLNILLEENGIVLSESDVELKDSVHTAAKCCESFYGNRCLQGGEAVMTIH